jgi:hypothetical protein
MFDDDDAERMMNTGSIPDGIIDGSQYAEVFQNLISNMKEIDQESQVSNMTWVMRCVNECYQDNEDGTSTFSNTRASDTVTALGYFVMTLIRGLDEEYLEEYFRFHDEEVIPDMVANAQTIPWYDIKDEVKALMDLFEDIDNIEVDESDNNDDN